jgi:hypothetical protein
MFDYFFRPGKWDKEHQEKLEARALADAKAKAAREQEEHDRLQHEQHREAILHDRSRQLTAICGHSNIVMHNGEKLLAYLPGSTFLEPRAVREYVSGNTGVSFRIAKGVRWRVGGSQGHSESHDELREIDTGDFAVTSKRVIFCGAMRTVTIPREQVIGLASYDDGTLKMNKEGRDKAYAFSFDKSLTATIDGETFPVDGDFIATIMDQA